MRDDLERLKQRLPLLAYRRRHNWNPRRSAAQQEFVGLCPLQRETRPSFYVNARKNLFYCHGCGRGGDLIRFVELSLQLPFRQSVQHLERELAADPASELLAQTAAFYRLELHRYPEAMRYLRRRGFQDPALIEELGIGYARGGNLRRRLAALGYAPDLPLATGLIDNQGRDAFRRRVIFPCREHGQTVNLYGRSIGAAFPHRLLPRPKGGLFAWETVSRFATGARVESAFVILVEGLFDLAVLWQAGFRNTTCAIGTHLTPTQRANLRCWFNPRTRRYDVPTENCFYRVLKAVPVLAFQQALWAWQKARLGAADGGVVVLDGKALRGSGPTQLVGAVNVASGRTLGVEPVADKSNEIPAGQTLLDRLDLDGTIALMDALHTQVETARAIVKEGGGDYVLVVKGNQGDLQKQACHFLPEVFSPSVSNGG